VNAQHLRCALAERPFRAFTLVGLGGRAAAVVRDPADVRIPPRGGGVAFVRGAGGWEEVDLRLIREVRFCEPPDAGPPPAEAAAPPDAGPPPGGG
jgi:hypothetical protein